jgi:hypothetical protein
MTPDALGENSALAVGPGRKFIERQCLPAASAGLLLPALGLPHKKRAVATEPLARALLIQDPAHGISTAGQEPGDPGD